MGLPISLGALLLWVLCHTFLIEEVSAKPLAQALTIKLHPWLIFISLITLVITLWLFWEGAYWLGIPGALWLYLYLSIGVSRLP